MWKQFRRPPQDLAREASASPDPLAEVANKARGGDPAALRALLVAIAPSLLRVARQVLGADHPEVQDVAQEAAYGVLCALGRFRGECTLLHFACRAAVLASMNVRRRDLSQSIKVRRLAELHPREDDTACPERALLEQRAADAVRVLLGSLPEAQAEVLGLHHVVGLTALEIARVTQTPVETVRSRLRLGRQALRQLVLKDAQLSEVMGVKEDGHAR